jgi:hypothetical protein
MSEHRNSSLSFVLTVIIAIIIGLGLVFAFIYWDKNKTKDSNSTGTSTKEDARSDGIIEVPSEVSKIQDAIAMAVDGDTIKIAAGTYKDGVTNNGLSSVARIDKAITLEGAGRGKTILDGGEKVMFGIFVTDGIKSKVVIKDMTLRNFENNGINALNKLVEVSGMTISDNGNQGAYFKSSTHDAKFFNNIVVNNGFDGVRGERSGIEVYNNTIVGNGTGISFVLTDTDIKATSLGIYNNIITDNDDYGILYDYPAYPKDAVVDHNNVFGNGKAAYYQFKNNERTKSSKATPTPGTGELAQDPKFADEDNYVLPEGSKLLTASRSGGEIGVYGK